MKKIIIIRMQRNQFLRLFILSVLLLGIVNSCANISKKSSLDKNNESNSSGWYKGRRLFLDNHCAACHLGIEKDKEFNSYKLRLIDKEPEDKIINIRSVLKNNYHLDVKEEVDKFSNEEYEFLLEYLFTPRKKKTVS